MLKTRQDKTSYFVKQCSKQATLEMRSNVIFRVLSIFRLRLTLIFPFCSFMIIWLHAKCWVFLSPCQTMWEAGAAGNISRTLLNVTRPLLRPRPAHDPPAPLNRTDGRQRRPHPALFKLWRVLRSRFLRSDPLLLILDEHQNNQRGKCCTLGP